MTKTQTVFDKVRLDAQTLHEKISNDIAKAKTWADVKVAQAQAARLAATMKEIVGDKAIAAKADVKAAVAKLEAAAKLVQDKAVDVKADVDEANAALLAAVHKAAVSLSQAVANLRSDAAKTTEPKKVSA